MHHLGNEIDTSPNIITFQVILDQDITFLFDLKFEISREHLSFYYVFISDSMFKMGSIWNMKMLKIKDNDDYDENHLVSALAFDFAATPLSSPTPPI